MKIFESYFFTLFILSAASLHAADNGINAKGLKETQQNENLQSEQKGQAESKAKKEEAQLKFRTAIFNDDLTIAKQLYQEKLIDIDGYDQAGQTILTKNLAFRKLDTILWILQHADPRVTDRNGWTPLMHLAGDYPIVHNNENMNDGIIHHLVTQKVSPDTPCRFGFTPLMLASMVHLDARSYEVMMTLIAAKANVNAQTNTENFETANVPRVLQNLYRNCLVIQELFLSTPTTQSRNKFSPLMIAARGDDVEKVKLLLFARANPRQKNSAGETAAVLTGNREIQILLLRGLSEQEHDDVRKDFIEYTGKDLTKSKTANLFTAFKYKSAGISPTLSAYLDSKQPKQEITNDNGQNSDEQEAERPVKRLKTTHGKDSA